MVKVKPTSNYSHNCFYLYLLSEYQTPESEDISIDTKLPRKQATDQPIRNTPYPKSDEYNKSVYPQFGTDTVA
jgi:hypothetical protein